MELEDWLMDNRSILQPGTVLDESYQLDEVLGVGAFAITYLAADLRLGSKVAIKEFYPLAIVYRDASTTLRPTSDYHKDTFTRARERFIDEARTLARFEHPSIVKVVRVFQANATAYLVTHVERGVTLEAWLRGLGRQPTQQELDRIVSPLLDALEVMHAINVVHRDVAPDNIIVRPDGNPVLLDFGATPQLAIDSSAPMTGIVKHGYSPPEQYASDGGLQGPWSDLYALGATLYRAVAGRVPEQSTARVLEDHMPSAIAFGSNNFRHGFLKAIDSCLKVNRAERPQSVAQLRPMLFGDRPDSSMKQTSGARSSRVRVALAGTWIAVSVTLLGSAYLGLRYWAERARRSGAMHDAVQEVTDQNEGGAKKQAIIGPAQPKEPIHSPPVVNPVFRPTIEQERSLRPGAFLKDCDTCPELVIIAPGTFAMGSPLDESHRTEFEGPLHNVSFSRRLAVGRYAVTVAQFTEFVQATGYSYGQTCFTQDDRGWVERGDYSFLSPGFSQADDHPVVCVSWADAIEYVKWLSRRTTRSYRLLSEAEREYVTRAGTHTSYWWGSTAPVGEANFDSRPRNSSGGITGGTVPVDRGRANPWGLFNVHGNVAEWVEDCWQPNYSRAAADGTALEAQECSLRVVRGGAWTSWPEDIRSAYREMADRNDRYYHIGFRVARYVAD
jgi:formylglycine-generating enzyme required for sulfatase activity/tRNA A-37 threonylcarbamoyl transferase component Bud32